jgi:hypothetical protein
MLLKVYKFRRRKLKEQKHTRPVWRPEKKRCCFDYFVNERASSMLDRLELYCLVLSRQTVSKIRVTGVGCVLAGARHIHVSVVPGPDSSPHERQNADQVDAQLWSLSSALSQYTSRSRSGVLTPRHFVDARHGHHRRLNTSRAV